MYCKYCGSKLDDDARFCASCGAKTSLNNAVNQVANNFNNQATGIQSTQPVGYPNVQPVMVQNVPSANYVNPQPFVVQQPVTAQPVQNAAFANGQQIVYTNVQPVQQVPIRRTATVTPNTDPNSLASGAFGFGLTSLILSVIGIFVMFMLFAGNSEFGFYLPSVFSILGLIFAIVSKKKANKCISTGGATLSKVNTARVLSTIGLIFSIITTAICVFMILLLLYVFFLLLLW